MSLKLFAQELLIGLVLVNQGASARCCEDHDQCRDTIDSEWHEEMPDTPHLFKFLELFFLVIDQRSAEGIMKVSTTSEEKDQRNDPCGQSLALGFIETNPLRDIYRSLNGDASAEPIAAGEQKS